MKILPILVILFGFRPALGQEAPPEINGEGWQYVAAANPKAGEWERLELEQVSESVPRSVTTFTWTCLHVAADVVRFQEHRKTVCDLMGSSEEATIFEVSRKDGRTLRAWVRSPQGTAVEAKVQPPPPRPPSSSETPPKRRGRVSTQAIQIDGVERKCERVEIDTEIEVEGKTIRERTVYWFCPDLPPRKLVRYQDPAKFRAFEGTEWEGAPAQGSGRLLLSSSESSNQWKSRMTLVASGSDGKALFEVK